MLCCGSNWLLNLKAYRTTVWWKTVQPKDHQKFKKEMNISASRWYFLHYPKFSLLLHNSHNFMSLLSYLMKAWNQVCANQECKRNISFSVWILPFFANTHGRFQLRKMEDTLRTFHNSFVCIRDDSVCQTDMVYKICTISWHFRLFSTVIHIFISKKEISEIVNGCQHSVNRCRDQVMGYAA